LRSASALGPVCGIVGMFGAAPVVLNCPSFSRLLAGFCASAVVASSVAADTASIKRVLIETSLGAGAFYMPPLRAQLGTSARGRKGEGARDIAPWRYADPRA
jgi:hypothetical protein